MRPKWQRLIVQGGKYNGAIASQAKGASGAYAIRETSTRRVVYVGESSCGKLWKTLLRHFHAPDSFERVRESGVFKRGPSPYEVAIWVTSRGKRACRKGDANDVKAKEAQAKWIAKLDPSRNVDDGTSFDFGANVSAPERRHAFEGLVDNPGKRKKRGNPMRWDVLVPKGRKKVDPNDHSTYIYAGDVEASSEAGAMAALKERERLGYARHGSVYPKGTIVVRVTEDNPPTTLRLVELGRMTELKTTEHGKPKMRTWPLSSAPILAYDQRGKLVIVYGAKRAGAASSAARASYEKTHWGVKGRGALLEGGALEGKAPRIGHALSVTYTTRKGDDAAPVDYCHRFGEGGSGKVILPVIYGQKISGREALRFEGGSYRVTEAGIVG